MTRNGLVMERRRRPLSRGASYAVYTMEAWRTDGPPMLTTASRTKARACLDGRDWCAMPEPTMPGARAAIVRPSRRYL